jgi:hypothetical protein
MQKIILINVYLLKPETTLRTAKFKYFSAILVGGYLIVTLRPPI